MKQRGAVAELLARVWGKRWQATQHITIHQRRISLLAPNTQNWISIWHTTKHSCSFMCIPTPMAINYSYITIEVIEKVTFQSNTGWSSWAVIFFYWVVVLRDEFQISNQLGKGFGRLTNTIVIYFAFLMPWCSRSCMHTSLGTLLSLCSILCNKDLNRKMHFNFKRL